LESTGERVGGEHSGLGANVKERKEKGMKDISM
jgi:hypothetical protein